MSNADLHLSSHISKQFNAELDDIRQRVLTMGGLVEQQVSEAVRALTEADGELGQQVANRDYKVNAMEVGIDEECIRVLARRQPAATDLRLIMAVVKTITDLERIGDEAEKIGRMAASLAANPTPAGSLSPVETMGRRVSSMVHRVLDAFARLDAEDALEIAKEDRKVDSEYDAISRQCLTFMLEDPRTIRPVMDLQWAARALERIGDHASNIGEYVIYLIQGKDVRHTSLAQMEAELEARNG
ncbi:phosphate signaling complex protein PhoU [Abyssibacter profundi]|uniref:Phosphate-specific transport system accessory protein PhoU n=1 Tax=Abyssibacter profundi TaxID=2182787 RepID=A0A363UPQ5_9GAMM|nr:phosphate signaling complex protein PhoU [Abyssibacter profundi]MBV62656.1 phosphate transport system regulatory protein PhoU [Nevskiales bacterium]PWN57409.1 phosphate transport system regulatory protein PhoU [Abyssibacter profundi]